ncbi:MAG: hypothetical protein KatS3mg129_2185 [Leptospiraceae bacterium]|nr:MAG: hypothetical protein KatS3mg129_2185 [Leptospiraceae bacterium]
MPYPFEIILIFSFLSLLLVIGVFLRSTISLIQNFLIPSSIIGGILGLILLELSKSYHFYSYEKTISILEAFAYHFFNISFISIGLTPPDKVSEKLNQPVYKGSIWMALIQGITFPLQTFIGGLIVLLFIQLNWDLHPTFGFLFPLGFNEGPGQALSFGKVWEGFGFSHATTIGLTFATLGYLFCIFVGVPLANWTINKGYITNISKPSEEFIKGIYKSKQYEYIKYPHTIHNSSLEPLAFQFALVGIVLLLTYLFIISLSNFLPQDVSKMLWGFFFLFGLAIAVLLRNILKWFNKDYLINLFLQRKITSFAIDYLIISTIVAIQIQIFEKYILPILIIAFLGGFLTTMIIIFLGKKLKHYAWERIFAIFGTVTGTTSTGLLLLRIVDPEFKTPIAKEVAIMNLFSVPIIGTFTILINGYFWWKFSLLTMIGIFGGLMLIFLLATFFYIKRYQP